MKFAADGVGFAGLAAAGDVLDIMSRVGIATVLIHRNKNSDFGTFEASAKLLFRLVFLTDCKFGVYYVNVIDKYKDIRNSSLTRSTLF